MHCDPCDTKQTWDTSRYDLAVTCPPATVADITAQAIECGSGSGLTIITGGEPLLWQRTAAWEELMRSLPGVVHVETNGTIAPAPTSVNRIAFFSVSPKIGTMGAADPTRRRIKPAVLTAFAHLAHRGKAAFKFVAATSGEVDEAAELVITHKIPHKAVWIMPLGEDHDTFAANGRAIVGRVMHHGFNISGRLHLTLGVR